MKKLFLIDAYALIFRAHYAFIRRPITTATGFDTSAIFGFIKSLQEVLKKEQPTHMAVAFDPPGGSFRSRMYPAYKAQRDETPESIIAAVPVIKELLRAYRIPIFEVPDFEADDLIGAMAKHAEKEGFKVYMMTPDKDYGQLVSDNIFMYKPRRSGEEVEILGAAEICERYGITSPMQMIDILALWGDTSDNVPGAPGVGEKGAVKLIGQYGSVEGIYEHLHELKGKLQESLKTHEQQVLMAKKLVTIMTDVPFDWDESDLLLEPANEEELKALFVRYEFSSMLKELERKHVPEAPKVKPKNKVDSQQMSLFFQQEEETARLQTVHKTSLDVEHTYHMVQSKEDIRTLAALLQAQSIFAVDTETTGIEAFDSRMIGISFAIRAHEAWYVPVPIDKLSAQDIMENFRSVLENPAIAKIGQNIKFDILMLKQFNIEVRGELLDTMMMHYLLSPEGRHNMNYLSETYLGYSPIEIETLIGKKSSMQRSMANVPLDQITEYAAEDADVTLQLKEKLYPMLQSEGMAELYHRIEAPLIGVLADIEAAGVRINSEALRELQKMYNLELATLENDIRTLADEPQLNISSPKQLGTVLFDKLAINGSAAKKTKTKQYSTDEETLVSLQDKHPIVAKILEFRSLKKLLSSYIESLPGLVNKHTGKIHTSFNQAVTATGRLSSNKPNLQNIPIRDAKGREIRKTFIASDSEHVLLSADYSQIELRLMAHMSEDPNLIEAFLQGQDIHTATAAKIFHVPLEEVTKDQRNKAKTANFGIIYGISSFGLSQRLNISRTEAKQLIDGYFESYPGVKKYIDRSITSAQKLNYTSTLFGRKRWLRDINSGNALARGNAERNAINAPIQGTAADIIKIAMIRINDRIREKRYKSRMILQVHDELVFDVYRPELDEMTRMVVQEMQQAADLKVPLIVEQGVGDNWLEAH